MAELELYRAVLIERIGALRPRAFRRIELQARLADTTRRILELVIAESRAADHGRELKYFQE